MPIDPRTQSADINYRLMTGIVVPRPIAWVTTRSLSGVVNLAPFSAFTLLSNKPVLLGINIGRRAGQRKDTAVNILATGEFVVHIGSSLHIAAIHESSAELGPGVSEVDLLELPTCDCDIVRVPRLPDAPVAMECKLDRVVPFGDTGSELFVGEVLLVHLREGLQQDGKIDTRTLDPASRIAGPNYATVGEIVSMRPIEQTPKSTMSGA